jgi:cysteinyl-tRNA synthetase, unknown class
MRRLCIIGLLGLCLACPSQQDVEATTFYPKSIAYLLQADAKKRPRDKALTLLADSGRDLVIIDYSFSGDRFGKWSTAELNKLRAQKPGRKIVAYLSIGEAENYRGYWQPVWDRDNNTQPDDGAPGFLLAGNPQWVGNYRVKYWDSFWQNIIIRYVDEIILQGFDGLYLDIVDGFQFFEYNPLNNKSVANKINEETKQSYRQDMVDWVVRISQHARRKKPDVLIIPQNGSQLLAFDAFVTHISAISLEDFFTEGNRKQPESRIRLINQYLTPMREANKPILVVEYPTNKTLKEYVRTEADKLGYTILITDRKLRTIGE